MSPGLLGSGGHSLLLSLLSGSQAAQPRALCLAGVRERSEVMNQGAARGWPEPWVMRTPVFYDFSRRDQRARGFSKEVNAKTEPLSAETGAVGIFS